MSTIKVTPGVQKEIDSYRQYMLDNEYTQQTALGYSTYLSRYLRQLSCVETDCAKERVALFLEDQRECNPENFKECRAALYLYLKMMTGECIPRRAPRTSIPEIEAIIRRFHDYSVEIKRISVGSANSEASHVRDFLEHISRNDSNRLESITAFEIRDYVVDRLAHLKDSSKGRMVTSVRNFFRFQRFEGAPVHESVFLLPLSPAVWKNAPFPATMDDAVFSSLHEVPNKDTATGKRNRCIILCFTELALRCIEVASLTLDDFNWHEGYVSIKNTKNKSDRKLPISEKLGQSIIEYLQSARPMSASRTLFVRFRHTCGEPMGVSQVRGVVGRVYAKSGAEIKATGTHILRRTAGTKLYNSGNSLKLTADILGHESLDSTVLYTKADMIGLRQVAAPWPGMTAAGGHYE